MIQRYFVRKDTLLSPLPPEKGTAVPTAPYGFVTHDHCFKSMSWLKFHSSLQILYSLQTNISEGDKRLLKFWEASYESSEQVRRQRHLNLYSKFWYMETHEKRGPAPFLKQVTVRGVGCFCRSLPLNIMVSVHKGARSNRLKKYRIAITSANVHQIAMAPALSDKGPTTAWLYSCQETKDLKYATPSSTLHPTDGNSINHDVVYGCLEDAIFS